VTHPLTANGVLHSDAVGDAVKAKIVKHQPWLFEAGCGFLPFACSTLGAVNHDSLRFLLLMSWVIAEIEDKAAVATAGADACGFHKTVEQRRGEIFARERSALMLTVLRAAAMRLTGKHWDRGLSAGQRRAVAARDAADAEEEERSSLQAPALPVVQAFSVG